MARNTWVDAALFFALAGLVIAMAIQRLRLRRQGVQVAPGGALLWSLGWSGVLLAARLSGKF